VIVSGIDTLIIRDLGLCDYEPVFQKMQRFSDQRSVDTSDEIWILEHYPVYTLGRAAKKNHILDPGEIPIVQIDRGGQVTYHGPGQIVIYLLLDVRRNKLGVRQIVTAMENAVIDLLKSESINSSSRPDAPGVYVNDEKIAALGLRIKRGMSYHGLCFNVDMDLSPYDGINPCGFENLKVTQLNDLLADYSLQDVKQKLTSQLIQHLNLESKTQVTLSA